MNTEFDIFQATVDLDYIYNKIIITRGPWFILPRENNGLIPTPNIIFHLVLPLFSIV